jgi:hypothetical protein
MRLQAVYDILRNLVGVTEVKAALAAACSFVLICNHIRFDESPQLVGLWGKSGMC